jgi:hypothetical protein
VLETVRILVAGGIFMLVLLLRLEAQRFGAAEYDEPKNPYRPGLLTRLSWYVLGFGLLAAIYVVHPYPHDDLYLIAGHREDVLTFGMLLAGIGVLQAGAFAWYRYGELRLPAASAYPGAGINAIASAVIDELSFRGVLLGTLVTIGVPAWNAVLLQAVIYVLFTRLGAPGRHPYMLLLSLGIGVAAGWATVTTAGVGAAVVGHAVTSFALFVCTGHAGQVTHRGREPEELEQKRRVPDGWLDARRALRTHDGAESLGLVDARTRRTAPTGPLPEPRNLAPDSAAESGRSEPRWALPLGDDPDAAVPPSGASDSVRRSRSPRGRVGEGQG